MTTSVRSAAPRGEVDLASVAALFAEPARARILTALADGRALPASVLAAESGVAPSTASEHLTRLSAAGLLDVERSGRHRYFRLASAAVVDAIEALAVLAPQKPVRSLRESTRAAAVRRARTCYDHLAGQLGVDLTAALVQRRALTRIDGGTGVERGRHDHLAAAVAGQPYRLGPAAGDVLGRRLGIDLDALDAGTRPVLRFCVDWSEQRHHLAGALGAAVLARLLDAGWLRRTPVPRAVEPTPAGRAALADLLGLR
jgi:DNA-binding transcriptional ArsR family regulator